MSPSQDIPRIHLSIHLRYPRTVHFIALRYVTLRYVIFPYVTLHIYVHSCSMAQNMKNGKQSFSRIKTQVGIQPASGAFPGDPLVTRSCSGNESLASTFSTFVTFIQQAAGSRGQLPTIVSEETSCFEVEQWFPANCPSNQSNDSCSMTCEGH